MEVSQNPKVPHPYLERPVESIPGRVASSEEEELLLDCMTWMEEQGLPTGDFEFELVDEEDNQVLAVLDLAWENGIQIGRSQSVALLIDEDERTLAVAQLYGYRCFTNAGTAPRICEKGHLRRGRGPRLTTLAYFRC